MKRLHALLSTPLLLVLAACADLGTAARAPAPCTEQWYRHVEATVSTGDGMGHGPDIGSEEWQSVVEFKLGVRGIPQVPNRDSPEWCGFIDDLLQGRSTVQPRPPR